MNDLNKKSKVRSYFFRNRDICSIKSQLKALKKKQRQAKKYDKVIVDDFNSKAFVGCDSDWADKLPIESLRELCDFSQGKKIDYNLNILKERHVLEKKREGNFKELARLNEQIYILNIDLLLAKVKCCEGYL